MLPRRDALELVGQLRRGGEVELPADRDLDRGAGLVGLYP
jgi:hypothetical protein